MIICNLPPIKGNQETPLIFWGQPNEAGVTARCEVFGAVVLVHGVVRDDDFLTLEQVGIGEKPRINKRLIAGRIKGNQWLIRPNQLFKWWLVGGNSNIFGMFTPEIGEDSHFDQYFSDGLKPPTRKAGRIFSIIDDWLLFFFWCFYTYILYIFKYLYIHTCVWVLLLNLNLFFKVVNSQPCCLCVCVSCVCLFEDCYSIF